MYSKHIKHNDKLTYNASNRYACFLCYEPSVCLGSNLLCLLSGKLTGRFSAASVTDSKFLYPQREGERGQSGGMDGREGENGREGSGPGRKLRETEVGEGERRDNRLRV